MSSVYSAQAVFTIFVAMHRLSSGISSPPSLSVHTRHTVHRILQPCSLRSSRTTAPITMANLILLFSSLLSLVGVAGLNHLLSRLYGVLSVDGLACWSRLASDQRGVKINILLFIKIRTPYLAKYSALFHCIIFIRITNTIRTESGGGGCSDVSLHRGGTVSITANFDSPSCVLDLAVVAARDADAYCVQCSAYIDVLRSTYVLGLL